MNAPVLIEPDALYDDKTLRQTLGLSEAALAEARRDSSLRHTRKGHRTLYKGAWILAWLESKATPSSNEQGEQSQGKAS